MTTHVFPNEPERLLGPEAFAPAARRELRLFGAPVELVLLPERAARPGAPRASRPPFLASPAARILATETLWADERHALTPNRWPFARGHSILWRRDGAREPDAPLLARAFAAAATRGSALGNAIGAAASIPDAHLHLVAERLPFLDAIAAEPYAIDASVPGLASFRLALPCLVVGLRGAPELRAAAAAELLRARRTAACNLVAMRDVTWLYPRSGVETPAPDFPAALGACELWGRWCFSAEAAFAAASGAALERALIAAGVPAG